MNPPYVSLGSMSLAKIGFEDGNKKAPRTLKQEACVLHYLST